MTWSSAGLTLLQSLAAEDSEVTPSWTLQVLEYLKDHGSSPPLSVMVKGALGSCWGQEAARGEVTTPADIKEQVNYKASFLLSIIALQS